jgi:hypothetical protein
MNPITNGLGSRKRKKENCTPFRIMHGRLRVHKHALLHFLGHSCSRAIAPTQDISKRLGRITTHSERNFREDDPRPSMLSFLTASTTLIPAACRRDICLVQKSQGHLNLCTQLAHAFRKASVEIASIEGQDETKTCAIRGDTRAELPQTPRIRRQSDHFAPRIVSFFCLRWCLSSLDQGRLSRAEE